MPQQNTHTSLYQESQAKDNCGFGLIVNRHGTQNREVVKRSIAGLTSMTPVSYTHLTLPTIYSV